MLVVVILLAFNAGQSYRLLNKLIDNENRASTTKSVLRTIKDFYSAIQEAELGVRGYFLTRDDSYLAPYFQSLDSIKANLLLLKGYDYQIEGQLQRVERLEALLVQRLSDMGRNIEQKPEQSTFNKPPHYLTANILQSHRWLQEFSLIIDQFEKLEYAQLEEESRITKTSQEKVFYNLLVATIVAFVLVLLIGVLVNRAIRAQQQEAQRLEAMVEQRTRELQHYSSELQRSNRELQSFAFVASHDLQEPLRKIRTFGDRLQSSYAEQLGDGVGYLERMQKAATRMSRLIEDLLEFSRVATSSNPFEPVALDEALSDVLENLELTISETGAIIESDALPVIEADAFQMRQLLQNLLSNAIKFVAEGTRPHIQILCYPPADTPQVTAFRLEIIDNGIGIDPRFDDKIFAPFQRLHGRDHFAGTGIGLAICRRILERHGSTIQVISAEGQGSKFLISLPATHDRSLDQTAITDITS